MEMESFESFVSKLQEAPESADPSHLRLASVVAAVVDVVGQRGMDLSSTAVFQAALVTLEGGLQKRKGNRVEFTDSMNTQIALLELLRSTLPFMEFTALVQETPFTARVLQMLRDWILSLNIEASDRAVGDDDGSGCMVSILCSMCFFSAALIQHLSASGDGVDDRLVKQLLRGILLFLLNDHHARVRKCASKNITLLLQMKEPKCHSAVAAEMNGRILAALDSIRSAADPANTSADQVKMSLLDLASKSIMDLDFATIGERQIGIITMLAAKSSLRKEQFILEKKQSAALVINVLLSTILGIVASNDGNKAADIFSGRVLATLLQIQPTLILQGDHEAGMAGREILSQIVILAVGRLLESDHHKGTSLLPLSTNYLFSLAMQHKDNVDDNQPGSWFHHLRLVLQTNLLTVRSKDCTAHSKCCVGCLKAIKPMLRPSGKWMTGGPLSCVAELLAQLSPDDECRTQMIMSLISLRKDVAEGSKEGRALEDALLHVIKECGIDKFWDQIRFPQLCLKENDRARLAWLLRVMKQAGPPSGRECAFLGFFQDNLLPLARQFDTWANKNTSHGSEQELHAAGIWALFPCFCVHPKDLESALGRLAPVLVRAMKDKRYPELLISISSGITVLARGVSGRLEEVSDLADENEFAVFRSDARNVADLADKLLPTMFMLLHDPNIRREATCKETKSLHDEALAAAISSLARLARPDLLHTLFTKLIHRLLEASQSQNDPADKMCSLLALAQSLYSSSSLNESSVDLLYRALRPLVTTDETHPRVQKRSYRLLGDLCKSKSFLTDERRLDVLDLLTSSTSTIQIASRPMRLRCFQALVDSCELAEEDVHERLLSSVVGEILLCLKDSNRKTRETTLTLLLALSKTVDIETLFRYIASAIASEVPTMRSAAVTALSKLVKERGQTDHQVHNLMPSLIETVLILSDDPSREVIGSTILFARVTVTVCPREVIGPLLPSMLDILLKYHESKKRFREKVKFVLKKVVKVFGYDFLLSLVSERDDQSAAYLKKLSLQDRKTSERRPGFSHARMDSLEDVMESDEEITYEEQNISDRVEASLPVRGGQLIRNADQKGFKGIHIAGKSHHDQRRLLVRNDATGDSLEVKNLTNRFKGDVETAFESDSGDELVFDERGKLVLKSGDIESGDGEGRNGLLNSSAEGERRANESRNAGSRKAGNACRARKAGGDVKLKSHKFDPYAYIPLNGRLYAKKNRRHAVEQLDSVVGARKRQKR